MANDKKISAQDAAVAVLKKAEEMLKKSALAKAPAETEVSAPDGIKPNVDSSAGDAKYNGNPEAGAIPPSSTGGLKGPLKLAKFMGRMEHKRTGKAAPSMDKGETGHEKGVHRAVDKRLTGISMAGGNLPAKGDKEVLDSSKQEHQKVISEQKAMPKPKLPG